MFSSSTGAAFETDGSGNNTYTAWFNGQPLHSSPLALQAVLNGLHQFKSSASVSVSETQVTVVNHPLARTLEQQEEAADGG